LKGVFIVTKIEIYRYVGSNGAIDSPIKLPMDYTLRYRLIADEGKELVSGDTVATVIDVDVDDVDKWIEQEAPRRNER
jgi:hypothetical protein